MTIDRKRIDAVKTLEALGYVYQEGKWIDEDCDWTDDGKGECISGADASFEIIEGQRATSPEITKAFVEQYKLNIEGLRDLATRSKRRS